MTLPIEDLKISDLSEKEKNKADSAAKTRKEKETQLENLIRKRTELKKSLGDNKEECGLVKGYVDFIFTLNPHIKEEITERRKKRAKDVFLTQQRDGEEKFVPKYGDNIDEEFKEIKRDYDLSEHDSDTEIPTGFSNFQEMLDLFKQHAAKNLSLIEEVQNREKMLDEDKKKYEKEIGGKLIRVNKIKDELHDLGEEEKRKAAKLSELTSESKSDVPRAVSASSTEAQAIVDVPALKTRIRNKVRRLYIFWTTGRYIETKELTDIDSGKSISGMLETITECLLRLKQLRDYKFMLAMKKEDTMKALIDDENKKNEEVKQKRAEAIREKNINAAEKKKDDLIANWKITRYRKFGKETMKKKVIRAGPKKKIGTNVQKVEDEFHDKYFEDYL